MEDVGSTDFTSAYDFMRQEIEFFADCLLLRVERRVMNWLARWVTVPVGIMVVVVGHDVQKNFDGVMCPV